MATAAPNDASSPRVIKGMIFFMFLMFAMTTDSVGLIIPRIIDEFHLNLTQAGAFHYTTMAAIALSAIFFGHVADRLGHRASIILGLSIFAGSALLFMTATSFPTFLLLLAASGTAIGIFKTGALALIGDISRSNTEHTSTMNLVEGFFGVGAIIGPAIVVRLIADGIAWQWLYAIAGTLSICLILTALFVRTPSRERVSAEPIDLKRTWVVMRNPYALAFSLGAFLYVSVECAIYVWMPLLLSNTSTNILTIAAYAMPTFFACRALGRFAGAWVTKRFEWTRVLALFSFLIFLCFAISIATGPKVATVLLPCSGLFMSLLYPTLNSKGISCFPREQHGAIAGVILFFTCLSATVGPLAMGAIGDITGDIRSGFVLATVMAFLLFAGLLFNALWKPASALLARMDAETDVALSTYSTPQP